MIRTTAHDASVNAKSSTQLSASMKQQCTLNRGIDEGRLTTKTKPRPGMEWHIRPPYAVKLTTFPSLRAELHCIVSINIFASVEIVRYVANAGSGANKDWSFSLWAASSWNQCGLLGYPNVDRDRRIEPKC